MSLRVSGGTLAAPIEFNGKSEGPYFYAYSEVSVLGDINMESDDGGYELGHIIISVPGLEERIYELDRSSPDIYIVGFTDEEGETIGHAFRPIEGEGGTLEILELSDDVLRVKFDSKFAPLTIGYSELVFHIAGEITIRN